MGKGNLNCLGPVRRALFAAAVTGDDVVRSAVRDAIGELEGFSPTENEVAAIKEAVAAHHRAGKSTPPMTSMPKSKHICALCEIGLITRDAVNRVIEIDPTGY